MAETKAIALSSTIKQNCEMIEIAKDCGYLCNYIYSHGKSAMEDMATGMAHLPSSSLSSSLSSDDLLFVDQVNNWVDRSKIVKLVNLSEEKFGYHTNFVILVSPKLSRIYVVYRGFFL